MDCGEPDEGAVDALAAALASHDPAAWSALAGHGFVAATSKPSRRPPLALFNPLARPGTDFAAMVREMVPLPEPPDPHGTEMAAEMAELYWMSLVRDVCLDARSARGQIAGIGTEASWSDAWRDLTTNFAFFKNFHGIGKPLPETSLFRAALPGNPLAFRGVAEGPWLSQFLLADEAKVLLGNPAVADPSKSDCLVVPDEWRDVQSGVNLVGTDALTYPHAPRFIRTGRDMAREVQTDAGFPELSTAFAVLCAGQADRADEASVFADWFAEVSSVALSVCFYHKWYIHRRIRPEEYAGRIHFSLLGDNPAEKWKEYGVAPEILASAKSGVLAATRLRNQKSHGTESYLLPQAYPEGCPTHPSYPSSHSTIAGAAVTLLKALFASERAMASSSGEPRYVMTASDDGGGVEKWVSPWPVSLTTGGELNKLASNIAFGRSFAGLHYRSDNIAGLFLGESVALSFLKKQASNNKTSTILPFSTFAGE